MKRMRNIDLFIDREKANLIEVDSFRDIQSIDINKYKNGNKTVHETQTLIINNCHYE